MRSVETPAEITCLRVALLLALWTTAAFCQDIPADSSGRTPLPSSDSTTFRVCAISIVGNEQTDEDVVRMYLKLDTGMVYDSIDIAEAEERLRRVDVFVKAKILSVRESTGEHLHVVVTERPRLFLADMGGVLYQNRYGEESTIWKLWRANVAVRINNVGGRLSSLTTAISFWEWRAVWLRWYTPLLPSPYYLSVSGGLYSFPFKSQPWRSHFARLSAVGGRRLNDYMRVYAGVVPDYNRISYHGPADPGRYSVERVPDNGAELSGELHTLSDRHADSTWVDTLRDGDSLEIRHWQGNPLWERDQHDKRFSEIYLAAGMVVDRRDHEYPHANGWFASSQLARNIPLSGWESTSGFVQLSGETRFYHRAWPGKATMAYRLHGAVRTSDGGQFHYLTTGSESTIRGFGSDYLGLSCRANNRATGTIEYRFPIFKTPPMHLPGITKLVLVTNDVYYQFDGAFFVDAGHLWHQAQHPLTEYETVVSAGTGIRMLIAPANRAICFDLVPLKYWRFRNEGTGAGASLTTGFTEPSKWSWHFYIDIQI